MATRMQQRRGTGTQWTTANPVLAAGEIGFETDTNQFKMGDGVNVWSSLTYFIDTTSLSTSLGDYVPLASAGAANGVATLDASGFVPAAQLNIAGDISSAVAALVDSAPATLDTLNELAAAIGDDATFITTINDSISLKQDDVVTTEGDLVIGGSGGAASRLPIGTNSQVLTLDSGYPVWADAPSTSFIVDMNASAFNTATLDSIKPAGPYSLSLDESSSGYDIYIFDTSGSVVGYTSGTEITASAPFSTIQVLGVSTTEILRFTFSGVISDASASGQQTSAGAYLVSITPSDLPSPDDTATVVGGNFDTDVEIVFISGATELPAKSITRSDPNSLIVTRPDGLNENDAPYSLKATNPGSQPTTGSGLNVLTNVVTAGSDPAWVTSSPLDQAINGVAFSQTLVASDAEGTITDYSIVSGALPTGLTLAAATGVISGTPTADGTFSFTIRVTDDSNNTTDKAFTQVSSPQIEGGTVTTESGYIYHTFTTSDLFKVNAGSVNAEILVVAGGGGGGNGNSSAGGGAGGMLTFSGQSLSSGDYTVTVGAGGNGGGSSGTTQLNTSGSPSTFGNLTATVGGGRGAVGNGEFPGLPGGSGGGSKEAGITYAGTSGQGQSGGTTNQTLSSGGGGGKGSSGNSSNSNTVAGNGGNGQSWYGTTYAGGGGGGQQGSSTSMSNGGSGGGGNGGAFSNDFNGNSGTNGLGGGGGGGQGFIGRGGNGVVIVRYAA
jgi:hypothetical protein